MEQFVIQSDNAGLARVEEFVSMLCDERNIRNHFAIISEAVTHAVENAIVHGNGGDASKQVVVECGECEGGLYFSVSDMGTGFDWSSFGGFPSDEGRGEGIFMMKTLADHVEYNAQGNTVRMEFHVRGIDRALTLERIATLEHFYEHSIVLEK